LKKIADFLGFDEIEFIDNQRLIVNQFQTLSKHTEICDSKIVVQLSNYSASRMLLSSAFLAESMYSFAAWRITGTGRCDA